jgi:signal transduction histidine kinase
LRKSDIYKFEFKILAGFIATIVLTIATMYIFSDFASVFKNVLNSYNIGLKFPEIKHFINALRPLTDLSFICLFLIYFHLLFWKKISCFLEINKAVEDISKGDFKARISVKSNDTLGVLSRNINRITEKFNSCIIEEKRLEQTKIDLITSVSHDLRTPLTSILGYLSLIDNDEYTDEYVIRSYVNIALNKTKSLKLLLDDLFELTTLDNYGIKLSKSKLNLIELIKQLVVEYKVNLEKAKIECRLNLLEEKIYVLGDSAKLVRAFENLISNCIKYSKLSKYMDITIKKTTNVVNVNFINYGEPIPPMDIPYIFQRFYRVEKSRSNETGGSGLGLAITKNIIELHNGKISVQSNNIKTVFKIELPLYN